MRFDKSEELHAFIREVFWRAEDVMYEEGDCIDWAAVLIEFLHACGIQAIPLIAYDPEFDEPEGLSCLHCMVWVPAWQESFDWRGAGAHLRWTRRAPAALWHLRPKLSGLLFDVFEEDRSAVRRRLDLGISSNRFAA